MSPTPPAFDLLDVSSDPQVGIDHVRAWLREYNLQANGPFMEKLERPESKPEPLVLLARSDGRILGGLVGETVFTWLRVSIMAIDPARRRQGIGAALLNRAETDARQRGCKYAYVDTMEYQAPAFYERQGYAIAGRLDDWDSHGHAKFFLTKRLIDAA
jgi:GNAT superfamily N-acetyltransferase